MVITEHRGIVVELQALSTLVEMVTLVAPTHNLRVLQFRQKVLDWPLGPSPAS